MSCIKPGMLNILTKCVDDQKFVELQIYNETQCKKNVKRI